LLISKFHRVWLKDDVLIGWTTGQGDWLRQAHCLACRRRTDHGSLPLSFPEHFAIAAYLVHFVVKSPYGLQLLHVCTISQSINQSVLETLNSRATSK